MLGFAPLVVASALNLKVLVASAVEVSSNGALGTQGLIRRTPLGITPDVRKGPDTLKSSIGISADGRLHNRAIGSALTAEEALGNSTLQTRASLNTGAFATKGDDETTTDKRIVKYALLKGHDDSECSTEIGEFEFGSMVSFQLSSNCVRVRKNKKPYGKMRWVCDHNGNLEINLFPAGADGKASCSMDKPRTLLVDNYYLHELTSKECTPAINEGNKKLQYLTIANADKIVWPPCAAGWSFYTKCLLGLLFALTCVSCCVAFHRYRPKKTEPPAGQQPPAPDAAGMPPPAYSPPA